jgi:hypothetical protein
VGTEWRQNIAVVSSAGFPNILFGVNLVQLISGFTKVGNTEIEYITIHFTLVCRSHCIVSVVTSE